MTYNEEWKKKFDHDNLWNWDILKGFLSAVGIDLTESQAMNLTYRFLRWCLIREKKNNKINPVNSHKTWLFTNILTSGVKVKHKVVAMTT